MRLDMCMYPFQLVPQISYLSCSFGHGSELVVVVEPFYWCSARYASTTDGGIVILPLTVLLQMECC